MKNNFNKNTEAYSHQLSQKEKEKDDFAWYKYHYNSVIRDSAGFTDPFNDEISDRRRRQVNYDIYNNLVNVKEYSHVCQPFGKEGLGTGTPVNFTHKDIVSDNINAILGIDMSRAFTWGAFSMNPEAIQTREQAEFEEFKTFVIQYVTKDIRIQAEQKAKAEIQGRELTPEEMQQIQQQIEQEVDSKSPESLKKSFQRTYKEEGEILITDLINYYMKKEDVEIKFQRGFKHLLLSGFEPYYVGIRGGRLVCNPVNAIEFECDRSNDLMFIEDGQWQKAVIEMTPAEIMELCGNELTKEEIDTVHKGQYANYNNDGLEFDENNVLGASNWRVTHVTFRSLRKIGILTFIDDEGEIQNDLVDEMYSFDREGGDIKIEWQFIPEYHEVYCIGADMYKLMRPVPGQYKTFDNLYYCKSPYKGVIMDNLNSKVTCTMDRMKVYNYMYDIIWYRIEELLAANKGKWLLLNQNIIPKKGTTPLKFLDFLSKTKIGLVDTTSDRTTIGNAAQQIDMSTANDIAGYLELAGYLEMKCHNVIGLNDSMKGQNAPDTAVRNTQQAITSSSYMLEPIFNLHNLAKRSVLQGIAETAIILHTIKGEESLAYITDDLTTQLFTVKPDLLAKMQAVVYVDNAGKAAKIKNTMENLAQAALQNQRADVSDIAKIMKGENIHSAIEQLELAEKRKSMEASQNAQELEKLKQQGELSKFEKQKELMGIEHDYNIEEIRVKGDIELTKQTILALGFAEDKDTNNNDVPDVLEIAKNAKDELLKRSKLDLERDKLEHQKVMDKEKLKLENKKINAKTT